MCVDVFADKTTLKGVKGKEQEYLLKKGMLNSAYGMSVTNPVNNECEFVENDEDIGGVWQEVEQDINGALLDSYIGNNKQFLLYQWGVWVTAWARHELFQGVLKMGIDVIYCDTDSIKYLHPDKYKTWVDEYNERVFNDMLKRCDDIGVSRDMVNPVTITGEHTPLGVFDYEKTYKYFKTLGAKRYAFSYTGDDFSITVSGLNKKRQFRIYWNTAKIITLARLIFLMMICTYLRSIPTETGLLNIPRVNQHYPIVI